MKKFLRQSRMALLLASLLIASAVSGAQLDPIKDLAPVFKQRELTLTPAQKKILADQRKLIADRKLNFLVAFTSVSAKPLAQITGEREVSADEVLRIQTLMKQKLALARESAALLWNEHSACVAQQSSYDARTENVVPEIRYQQCGNCWAYSCIGPIECSYIRSHHISNPATVDLSEKQIVACSGAGDCGGGLTYLALEWLSAKNIKIMDDPYARDDGQDKPCPPIPADAHVQLRDWGVVDPSGKIDRIPTVAQIKEALCKYGPIACSMDATPLFQNFGGNSVFVENPSNYDNPTSNHAVMIIGWDDEKQAWLMRNSWSTTWGDAGYAWIKYDTNNVGRRAVWVTVKNS